MTCIGFGLLAHISASKNVAHIQPIFSEFTVFFLRGRIYSPFDLFFELQSISWAGWTNNVASMRPIYVFPKKLQAICTFSEYMILLGLF